MPNIAIVWDFDNTLSPDDSTTKVVEVLRGEGKGNDFWGYIHTLKGTQKEFEWEHVLAMDAPIWMYALSRIAAEKRIPLNSEFFEKFVLSEIRLFDGVISFLKRLKDLQSLPAFQRLGLQIHHFVVSAGLKDLIELLFEKNLVTWTFGCRYTVVYSDEKYLNEPESVPVFCMDETMKTRSLFEISKGSFREQTKKVNQRIEKNNLWVPFTDMIYVGDGPTDIPALSLVRERGGMGIVVFDKSKPKEDIDRRLKSMRLDKRADFITAADYTAEGELYHFIATRCEQIRQRIEAESFLD